MTRLSVEFDWRLVTEVGFADGKPEFSALPTTAGVYRLTFHTPGGAPRVYIGETDNLRRRGRNYRNPGPKQRTSLRMNKELVAALTAGVRVSHAIVVGPTISLDGAPSRPLDLSRKTSRLILENAAIAAVIADREADPVNGPILVNRPGVGEAEWS
jgi:hypothetical protein